MKYFKLFIYLSMMFVLTACNDQKEENEAILTIEANPDSDYVNTFTDLNLGILFDFEINWKQADQSWITLWAEGYQNGEKIEPHLTGIAFGNSPNQTVEGPLGFGIINHDSKEPLIFTYSPGSSRKPHAFDALLSKSNMRTWHYAVEDEEIQLKQGETKILAAYLETSGNTISSGYNYQDEDDVDHIINSFDTVILFKVTVDENPIDF